LREDRVPTGVPGLDELIEGGLPKNRAHLIVGPPGSGKTTFAIQFLVDGAMNGENGVYFSFTDTKSNVIGDFSRMFPQIKKLVEEEKLIFFDFEDYLSYAPDLWAEEGKEEVYSMTPTTLFFELKRAIKRNNARRYVIDSISLIKFSGVLKEEIREIARFIRNLSSLNCTGIIISEMMDPGRYSIEQFFAHSVIFFHSFMQNNKMHRAIQVMKMRGTKHDNNMRVLQITSRGVRVGDEFEWILKSD